MMVILTRDLFHGGKNLIKGDLADLPSGEAQALIDEGLATKAATKKKKAATKEPAEG